MNIILLMLVLWCGEFLSRLWEGHFLICPKQVMVFKGATQTTPRSTQVTFVMVFVRSTGYTVV